MTGASEKRIARRLPLTMAWAREHGWLLEVRKPHPVLHRDGERVVIAGSPSDRRTDLNLRTRLRRRERRPTSM